MSQGARETVVFKYIYDPDNRVFKDPSDFSVQLKDGIIVKCEFSLTRELGSGEPAVVVRVENTMVPDKSVPDHERLFGQSSFEVNSATVPTEKPVSSRHPQDGKYEYKFCCKDLPCEEEGGGPVGGMTGTITVTPGR